MASNNNFTLNGANPLGLPSISSLGTQSSTPASSIKMAPIAPQGTGGSSLASKTPVSTPVPKTSGILSSPAYSSNGTPNFSQQSVTPQTTPVSSGMINNPGTQPQTQNWGVNSSPQTSTYTGYTSSSSPATVTTTPVNNNIDYSGTNQANPSGQPGTQPNQPPAPYAVNPNLQGQMITGLANQSQQPGAAYTTQQEEANRINAQTEEAKKQFAQQTNDINTSGTWTSRALGEQGQANIQNAAVLSALGSQYQGATNQLSAANTQQGLQQSALTSAIGANAPQFPSYASQVYSPSSGFLQGGNTLSDAVSTVVQRVQSGQMSYADATAALSGYGQGGVNALQQALGPNFNVAQSNTLSAQQGSIGPALQYANTAIANLKNSLGGLMTGQNTNMPIINQITQGISTTFGYGSQGVQNYKAAIAEARNAIQSVLASVRGGTPTDYVGQSNSLLPDNATPNQIAAAEETLKTLGNAKASIYQNPGNAGTSTASPASSGYTNGGAF